MGFGGYLQANTAVDVLIGPFIDDTDGKTAETALTLSQADIKLSKNGQALTQKNDDTAAAHDANGYYNCELNATDTNTEGTLTLIVHETGALPVRHDFMVLSQAAYTSLVTAKDAGYMDVNVKAISEDTTAPDNLELMYDGTGYAGGTTKLDVNVVTIAANAITATAINADAITNAKIADNAIAVENIADNAITAAKIATGAIDADAIANNAIDAATFAADVSAKIATDVWNAATASYGGAGTYGQAVEDTLADTNELQTNQGNWLTATGFSTHSAADVADAVWDEVLHTAHEEAGSASVLLQGATAPSAADVADAVWNETLADHLGAGSTGNALNAAGSAGDPWATALPGAYGAGTAGLLLGTTIPNAIDAIDNFVDTEIGTLTTELAKVPKSDSNVSWNATALAAIQGECTDALNAYDPPTNAEFELRTLPAADYTVVSDLGTVQTGDAFARLGAPAGESVSADIAAIKAETAAIVADTNELQVDDYPTSIAAVKTVVDAIQAKTDDLTFTAAGQVDANVQSVNDVALTGDGSATPWGPA